MVSQAQRRYFGKLHRQALRARRQMIRDGELLTEEEFLRRRAISAKQLSSFLKSGSVFSVTVDAGQYYPALLADSALRVRRLATLCRVLWPAEAHSRLHFLTSRSYALGGMTPLEAMGSDGGYRQLLRVARGWASEWSRTSVAIHVGEYIGGKTDLPLACTGVAEIDPRISIWRRALEALTSQGNVRPDGPYAKAAAATVFISRSEAGQTGDVKEARLDVIIDKQIAHAGVAAVDLPRSDLRPVRVDMADDVVDVVRKILSHAVGAAKPRALP